MWDCLALHIANQDALDLREASEGFGTDEEKMAKVIVRNSNTVELIFNETDISWMAKHVRNATSGRTGQGWLQAGPRPGRAGSKQGPRKA